MNYEELSLQDLKEIAKEKGLKNISKLKKEDLITFLNEIEQENKQEKPIGRGKEKKEGAKEGIGRKEICWRHHIHGKARLGSRRYCNRKVL